MSQSARTPFAIILTVAAASLLGTFLPGPAAAEDGRVRQKQKVADLLETGKTAGREPPAPRESAAEAEGRGLLLQWASGAGALGLLACAVVSVRRRRGRSWPGAQGGAAVRVAARVALSHRHSVVLLKVGRRGVLVGISGDRMFDLGSFEDPGGEKAPADKLSVERGLNERIAEPRGFSFRAEDRDAVSGARSTNDPYLAPYRRQLDRLRDLLRGMRSDGVEDGATEEGPRL